MKISVIGAGAWGTTFAELLGKKGFEVALWVHGKDTYKSILEEKENKFYLKGINLLHINTVTMNLEEAISYSKLLIIALPTQQIRNTLKKILISSDTVVLTLSKGIEIGTFKRPSEVIREVMSLEINKVYALSGPNFAYEIASEMPAATVIGGKDEIVLKELQTIVSTDYFRAYYSLDLNGVELGGALKNVYAISCGISDGLGFGDSSKASIIARSLPELIKIGTVLGGEKETFFGLSGSGDLIATAFSKRSRNRNAGEKIGKGRNRIDIEKETREVIEGFYTLKAIYDLNSELKLDLPIIDSLYRIVYLEKDPKVEILNLMKRPFKQELI